MSKPPAKKPAPISRGTPEQYNRVASVAQLRGIQLATSAFAFKPDGSVFQEWAFALNSKMTDCEYIAQDGHLYCVYRYEAVCKHARKRVLALDASFIISFDVDGDCNLESAQAYAAIIGRVAAYPHFRALFATLTSQAGLMLPPLPIMSEQPRRVDKVLQSFGNIDDRGQEETR